MRTVIPLVAAGVLVLAGITLAFTLTGSPAHQRELAFDRKRIELLQEMTSAIDSRYERTDLPVRLPPDLRKNDPESQKPFDYARTGRLSYRLCATFVQASPDDMYDQQWRHAKGRRCFDLSARQ